MTWDKEYVQMYMTLYDEEKERESNVTSQFPSLIRWYSMWNTNLMW